MLIGTHKVLLVKTEDTIS